MFFVMILLNSHFVKSQSDSIDRKFIHSIFTKDKIKVDGIILDEAWKSAEINSQFFQKNPLVLPNAEPKTEFQVLHDHENIYIAVTCYQPFKSIIQTVKRDQDYFDSDGIAILLDPFQNKSSGYLFGVSSSAIQSEAILTSLNVTFEWDAKWYAQTKQYNDRWTAEIQIPFKILKFDTKNKIWGINLARNLTAISQYHTWNKVPQQFQGIDIGFLGLIEFKEIPKSKQILTSLIPYAKSTYRQPTQDEPYFTAGIQTKHNIDTKFNLDLAVNPDFSQTDIDEQVTNLSRFSIFLPENRTFFIDNSDIFGSYGIGSIKPFFSRTIGLDNNGRTIPILAGARLTGNINPKLRMGLMNMTTAKTSEKDLANYSAATLYQNLWSRSRIKAIFLNKQNIGNNSNDNYGRNTAAEFTYIKKDGSIIAWTGFSNSFKKNYNSKNHFLLSGIYYTGKNFETSIDFSSVGTNYYTDMGYVLRIENYDAARDTTIRKGFHQSSQNISYRKYYSEISKFAESGLYLENFIVANSNLSFNERISEIGSYLNLKNGNEMNLNLSQSEVNLPFPYKFVTDENSKNLESKIYSFANLELNFNSAKRNKLSYDFSTAYGGFFNGTKFTTNIGVNYRIQAIANLGLRYDIDYIKLAEGYGEDRFNRLVVKAEFFLTKKIFFTNFLQYVDQINRFTLNSKLQWNFAPLSDLFLVYLDDYNTSIFSFGEGQAGRNYSIALKVNYWLDL